MKLIADMEGFMHLMAQAIARARGDEQPHIFADVVVGHARDIAKQDDETNEISAAVAKNDEQLLAATPAAEVEKDSESTEPAKAEPLESPSAAAVDAPPAEPPEQETPAEETKSEDQHNDQQ